MRFLIDAQLPPILARQLAALGHDAIHLLELGAVAANDREVWERAVSMGAAIVTKDEDFVTLRALNSSGPTIIWVRIGNARNRDLIARFFAVFPDVLGAIERGESVVEISGP